MSKFNVTLFETKNNLFLVSNSPIDNDMNEFLSILHKNHINTVIRFCDKIYNEKNMINKDIHFYDMYIEDGLIPNDDAIKQFLDICSKHKNIALHCKSGLGRAPTMLSIALIVKEKLDIMESITLIRNKIKGAFNTKQLNFIINDIPRKKNIYKGDNNCQIM
jgi:protein tyrosine phosphatase type 4A